MTEEEILNTLDNSNDGYYCSFVELGHVYSYLIDTRLNVFRADNDRWAIAIERLGYNPRAGAIMQEILSDDWNREIWENNRPGSYETWQLIAKVIATNDLNQYKPTLEPNTHWTNWTDSGSM